MNITEHEMRGLLTGKAMPADILVGESLAAYLVRKFSELKAQRDALAAENAALNSAISEHSEGFTVCPCCGTEHDSSHDDVCRAVNETPATAAYLNSVRAEGVEMAADFLKLKNTVGSTNAMAYLLNTMAFELLAGEPS